MMVTGKMPFDGCGPLDAWMKKSNNEFPAPKELEPGISDRVDWAVRRAMSANPEMRPMSCREFFEDITGTSTRPAPSQSAALQDLWYMAYRDDEGTTHTVKGTTDNIRRAYRDGLLGDAANIRAARSKLGPFQALKIFPELRDLVVSPDNPPEPAPGTGVERPSQMRRTVPSTVGANNSGSAYDPTVAYQPHVQGAW